jgi:DNA-binding response OmpR family regulator
LSYPLARILYAEDRADTRELVACILAQNDCEIVTTDSYDQSLHLARNNNFDLYILDNWLPDGSGVDLCLRLRQLDPATPILFYSAAAFQADKNRALSAGAQAYLTKPVDSDELVATVFRLIEASRAMRV